MNAATSKKIKAAHKCVSKTGDKEYCCATRKTEDELYDVAREAGRQMRSFINSADKEISGATDFVVTNIKEKPVQSGAIVLGIGVLLGFLFRRTSKGSSNVNDQ